MLSTRDVWRLGEEARAQLDASSQPCMTFTHIAARIRTLRINGLELETCWAFEPDLRDDRNRSVMGVIEFDPEVPRTALMSLNSTALAGREDVTMSTAAHEFGHAIFDAPGWMVAAERQAVKDAEATRRFRSVVRRYRSAKPLNISEWRAHEFMGAFLAPPKLLRWQMTRIMRELMRNAIAELRAEQVFINLLSEFAAEGRHVSATPSANYAPAVFARDIRAENLSKRGLIEAMGRLFARGRIQVQEEGPKSRRRSFITLRDTG